MKNKILITGASGQLGTVLVKKLQEKHGVDQVIATDLHFNENFNGFFKKLEKI